MASVLASNAVDRGIEPRSDKPKAIKLVFAVSTLGTHQGERATNDWLGIRIMLPSGATCLPADCSFSELML